MEHTSHPLLGQPQARKMLITDCMICKKLKSHSLGAFVLMREWAILEGMKE
jgi:hypothetical protein